MVSLGQVVAPRQPLMLQLEAPSHCTRQLPPPEQLTKQLLAFSQSTAHVDPTQLTLTLEVPRASMVQVAPWVQAVVKVDPLRRSTAHVVAEPEQLAAQSLCVHATS